MAEAAATWWQELQGGRRRSRQQRPDRCLARDNRDLIPLRLEGLSPLVDEPGASPGSVADAQMGIAQRDAKPIDELLRLRSADVDVPPADSSIAASAACRSG